MTAVTNADRLGELLTALADQLDHRGERLELVVVGGAGLMPSARSIARRRTSMSLH